MTSPFADILHTNAVPSDSERDVIYNLLEVPRKKLAEATEEITCLQAIMDEAIKRRDELREFIDAHLALLSPTRRLPEDVIRSVFLAALPSPGNASFSSDEAPLLLCQICRSWRNIALTTPRLWASIHIVLPGQAILPLLTGRVKTWLGRSGTVPLAITIVSSQIPGALDCDFSDLLSVLITASRRWRSIELAAYNTGITPLLLSLSSEDVPLLQNLVIKDDTADTTTPLQILMGTSLRSFAFPGSDYYLHSSVTWSLLKHLKIHWNYRLSPSSATIFPILAQCNLLETCEVTLCGPCGPLDAFSLPHLRHLAIMETGGVPFDASNIFKSIQLPSLRSLHCQTSFSPRVFAECLIPSIDTLECLWVSIPALKSEFLLAALANMPFLQELQIIGDPVTGPITDATLTVDPDFLSQLSPDQGLCPRLRRVELLHFAWVSDQSIRAFVKSRTAPQSTQGVNCLSHFRCIVHRSSQEPLDLEDAIADGLVVDVEYITPEFMKYSPLEGTGREAGYMHMIAHAAGY